MAGNQANFQYCLDHLRNADRDRYLACLLVPEAVRGPFAALYAFNAEIARVRDIVHEPMPGEVRLQWWRDLINGEPHGAAEANPIAAALMETVELHSLPRATFDSYIDGRIFDLYDDPMPDRDAFEGYAGETVSALIQLCALVVSHEEASRAADAAGHGGVALAVAGAFLLMPIHRRRGQVYVPGDILAATGLHRDSFLEGNDRERCRLALAAFADLGREHLARARTAMREVSASLFPAFLPVALAGPVLERAVRGSDSVLDEGIAAPQWRRQWWLWRAARRRRL